MVGILVGKSMKIAIAISVPGLLLLLGQVMQNVLILMHAWTAPAARYPYQKTFTFIYVHAPLKGPAATGATIFHQAPLAAQHTVHPIIITRTLTITAIK
jgi:hypothetical protein